MKFPIKDLDWHHAQAVDIDPSDAVSITYHTTAIAYLECGRFHGIDGPAIEVDGKPIRIEREFQMGIDKFGNPFMRHFPEE